MTLTRYEVRLTVGRTLTRALDARDDQAAEDIAQYLYSTFGARMFEWAPEEVIDCLVMPDDEEAAR